MKIGLPSLGCPKNLVDSEVMLGLAQQAGHELTHDAAEADLLVVNTCAFIDRAKQESIDAILEMAGQKQQGRCQRLVVTGCLAERYRDELKAEIPEIDVVLGTGPFRLTWQALPGASGYVVYRGDMPELRSGNYGNCLTTDGDLTETEFEDSATPQVGDYFFYLVAARVAGQEWTIGVGSSRQERILQPSARCP